MGELTRYRIPRKSTFGLQRLIRSRFKVALTGLITAGSAVGSFTQMYLAKLFHWSSCIGASRSQTLRVGYTVIPDRSSLPDAATTDADPTPAVSIHFVGPSDRWIAAAATARGLWVRGPSPR